MKFSTTYLKEILHIIPCHRLPERSLHFKGKHFPLCYRCMCMLLGYLAIPVIYYFYWNVPLYLGIILNIPMLVDGFTQKWKWRKSNNTLRIITGLLSGVGMSCIIIFLVHLLLSVTDFILGV